MVCRKPGGCGAEFCWVCLGPWTGGLRLQRTRGGVAVGVALLRIRSTRAARTFSQPWAPSQPPPLRMPPLAHRTPHTVRRLLPLDFAAWLAADHRDYFHCNRPPRKAGAGEDAAKRSAQELAVFAFYSTRYGEALRSGTHAEGTRARVSAFQQQLQEACGASAGEVEFMSRALDVVIRGRNVAAWSYVHAFFVVDPAYRTLLEDSQGLMERNLEQLHGNLELSAINRVLSGDDADAKAPPSAYSSSSSSSSGSATGSAAPYAGSSRSAGAGVGSRATAMVQRRFAEWRQRSMMLLAATDRFIDRLLEAVEEGLLEDGRGYGAAPAPAHAGAGCSAAEAAGAGASSAEAVVAGSSAALEEAVVAGSSSVEGPGAPQEGAGDGSRGATRHASSVRPGAGSRRTRSQAAAEAAGTSVGGSAGSGKRARFADNEDT